MPETINVEIRRGDFSAEVARAGKGPPLLYLHGAVGQKAGRRSWTGWRRPSPSMRRLCLATARRQDWST